MMVILVIFDVDRNYMMIIFVCARENQKYDYVLHLEARIFVSLFVCCYKGNIPCTFRDRKRTSKV